jgi:hypothetical protein
MEIFLASLENTDLWHRHPEPREGSRNETPPALMVVPLKKLGGILQS